MSSDPASSSAPNTDSKSPAVPGAGIDYERFLDCVHCGLCTSACPTYLETGNENDSPRGRIYLMRAVVDGRLNVTESVQRHLDLCLDCRSCETACPSGVQYGRLIEPFRVDLQRDKLSRPGWFERFFLYGLFPHPGRMAIALWPVRVLQTTGLDRIISRFNLHRLLPARLERMYEQLPKLQPRGNVLREVLPAIGERRARVGLITGCVAEAMFSQTNRATARVLQQNGCEVVIPKAQACCGAIHYHSGASEPALDFARKNAAAFDVDELDAVIVNVAGCGSMLKDYGHVAEEAKLDAQSTAQLQKFADKVRDVSEFLMELGPRPPRGELKIRATYHDACHLCHAQQIRTQPRDILRLIPGLDLIPLEESEICCGAAGSYSITEPEMAGRLGARKVGHILKTDARIVVTGNAGCQLQIQANLRRRNSRIPVYHPMELLDLSYSEKPLPLETDG